MRKESGSRGSTLETNHGPIEGLLAEEQSRRARAKPSSPWLIAAVVLSAVAGLIHLAVAPEHFQEWFGYGVFFTVVGIGQLAYAFVLAYRPDQRLLSTGLVGTAWLFGLYVVTRTIGIPWFGPLAGEVEPVGLHDLLSKSVEAGLIGCLALQRVQQARLANRPDRVIP